MLAAREHLSRLKHKFFPARSRSLNQGDQAAASHLANAFLSAPVINRPWPHVFIENVFPQDFYRRIEEALARSGESFKAQVHTGDRKVFHGSYEDRHEFRVARTGAEARTDLDPFWFELHDVLTSDLFFNALHKKFNNEYRGRFGDFMDHPRFKQFIDPSLLVTKHKPNYYIGPHTDRAEKVVTCIFNVPESQGFDDIGTALYTAKKDGFSSDGLLHLNPEDFNYECTTPFRPNSALIFFRTDVSFHGVERLTEANLRGSNRYNIQFNLWDWARRP